MIQPGKSRKGKAGFKSTFAALEADALPLGQQGGLVVCWLINVPATYKCISGTDLLRQFDVLPH